MIVQGCCMKCGRVFDAHWHIMDVVKCVCGAWGPDVRIETDESFEDYEIGVQNEIDD